MQSHCEYIYIYVIHKPKNKCGSCLKKACYHLCKHGWAYTSEPTIFLTSCSVASAAAAPPESSRTSLEEEKDDCICSTQTEQRPKNRYKTQEKKELKHIFNNYVIHLIHITVHATPLGTYHAGAHRCNFPRQKLGPPGQRHVEQL